MGLIQVRGMNNALSVGNVLSLTLKMLLFQIQFLIKLLRVLKNFSGIETR